MDFAIDMAGGLGEMTFEKPEDIRNNVFLSLAVRRGSFFQNPAFGSRLHLLKRAKNTTKTAQLAVEYAKEALQWLLDTDKARKVEVTTEQDRTQDLHRLKLLVEATQADERKVIFTTFVEVV
ncbi:MAG: phage GP46 family protein [Endomicrobiales bacterium]